MINEKQKELLLRYWTGELSEIDRKTLGEELEADNFFRTSIKGLDLALFEINLKVELEAYKEQRLKRIKLMRYVVFSALIIGLIAALSLFYPKSKPVVEVVKPAIIDTMNNKNNHLSPIDTVSLKIPLVFKKIDSIRTEKIIDSKKEKGIHLYFREELKENSECFTLLIRVDTRFNYDKRSYQKLTIPINTKKFICYFEKHYSPPNISELRDDSYKIRWKSWCRVLIYRGKVIPHEIHTDCEIFNQ